MSMVEETVAISADLQLLDYTRYNYHNLQRAEGKLVRHFSGKLFCATVA